MKKNTIQFTNSKYVMYNRFGQVIIKNVFLAKGVKKYFRYKRK